MNIPPPTPLLVAVAFLGHFVAGSNIGMNMDRNGEVSWRHVIALFLFFCWIVAFEVTRGRIYDRSLPSRRSPGWLKIPYRIRLEAATVAQIIMPVWINLQIIGLALAGLRFILNRRNFRNTKELFAAFDEYRRNLSHEYILRVRAASDRWIRPSIATEVWPNAAE